MPELHDQVVRLDELDDFEVADGQPDVRGWDVLAADRRKIGEVDNLLVDTAAMRVRYLDVDLDEAMLEGRRGNDRHILVPIAYAQLDESRRNVMVNALQSTDVASMPRYMRERITPEYESSLRERFDSRGSGAGEEKRMVLAEEQLLVGKREVTAGAVEITKEVETEHVRRSVPVSHQEVSVERRPATPAMAAEARIENDEIRVPVYKEELVVGKRVVPTEELVVRKRETLENKMVDADLRSEHAEVHREGETGGQDHR